MLRTVRTLVACVCLSIATSCLAQPASQMRPSLEAMVARADNVFLGTVTDFKSLTADKGNLGIAVHVGTVLKGHAAGVINLVIDLNFHPTENAALPNDTELLWFTTGKANVWAVVDIRDAPKKIPPRPAMSCLPIFGMDLKPISTRSDVLARLKSFLKAHPGQMKFRKVRAPKDLIWQVSPSTTYGGLVDDVVEESADPSEGVMGNYNYVIVPAVGG